MKKRFFAVVLSACLLFAASVPMALLTSADLEPYVEIFAERLVFGKSVYLNYAVCFENVPTEAETGLLVWKNAPSDKTYGHQEFKITNSIGQEKIEETDYTIYAFENISADEMARDIYAIAYIKDDDKITYSEMSKYSVLQYAYNKLGDSDTDDALKNLLSAMLEYGETVQLYSIATGQIANTNRLANHQFYQIAVENGTLPDGTNYGLYPEGSEVVLSTNSSYATWINENDTVVGTGASITVTVSEDMAYVAFLDILGSCNPETAVKSSAGGAEISVCEKDTDGVLTVTGSGAGWPDVEFTFDPIDIDIDSARLVIEAEITGEGDAAARIWLRAGTESIAVHQFASVSLNGNGDVPAGNNVVIDMPFSELAYYEWASQTPYGPFAGRIPFDSETVSLTGLNIRSYNGATITISTIRIVAN